MTGSETVALTWATVDESDLPDLIDLAVACLDADGGLPQLGSTAMVRSRLLGGATLGAHDGAGRLVAAAGLRAHDGTATACGLVHPAHRGQQLGSHLLTWMRDQAGDDRLVVRSETVAPDADALMVVYGLRRTFTETVMRHDLATVPTVAAPDGVTLRPAGPAAGAEMFAAYRASFADRPGFPDPPQDEWLAEVLEDEDFRADRSWVAYDPAGEPVAFLNALDAWIDQVGVVPAWRGRRLGAHLVSRLLTDMARAGEGPAWLCVNTDNPAGGLYQRLGFHVYGTRARWADSEE